MAWALVDTALVDAALVDTALVTTVALSSSLKCLYRSLTIEVPVLQLN